MHQQCGRWKAVPELLEGLLNSWAAEIGELRTGAEKRIKSPSNSFRTAELPSFPLKPYCALVLWLPEAVSVAISQRSR